MLMIGLFLLYFASPMLVDGRFVELVSGEWHPDSSFGLSAMIVGSALLSIGATLLAFIYAISITLTIDRLPRGSRVREGAIVLFRMLTAIPTVVYGFLGVILLLPFMRSISDGSGMSLLSAIVVLSLVITPTMVLFLHESFENVPPEYSTIIHSLGGDRVDYQLYLLLRYRYRGLILTLIMGFGRAVGDTMIALMLSGNATSLPSSPLDSIRTLTAHIALLFAGDFDSMEFQSIFASGLILFLSSAIVVMTLRSIRRADEQV